MLVGLLVGALALAGGVSLLPAEWQGPVVAPTALFPRPGLDARPREFPLPARTPDAPTTPPARGRDLAGRGFGAGALPATGIGGFTLHLASLLTMLSAGIVLLYLVPQRVGRIAAALGADVQWRARLRLGLLGVAGGLLIGALGVLAVITVIGAPVWLAILALGYFGAWLGLVSLSLPLGRWMGRRLGLAEQPPQIDLLTGLLGLFVINLVPFVGGLVLLVAALLGLGAVLQTRAGSDRPWTFGLPDLEY